MATPSKNIPIKRVQINHLSDLPDDYGTTPGGTMFSTTPGGTRIVYDRTFLLKYRSSELGKTPPTNLPEIPGVTVPEKKHSEVKEEATPRASDWRQALPFMNRNPLHQSQQPVRQPAAALPFIPGIAIPPMHFQQDAMAAAGPLQQYRQRSFIQQSSQLYKNMCEQVASMHEAFKQVLQKDPNSSSMFVDDAAANNRPPMQQHQPQQGVFDFPTPPRSQGDGPWQDGNVDPRPNGQPKKSQLSAWREAKMHAALEQYFNAAATTQAAAAMAQAVTVNGQHLGVAPRNQHFPNVPPAQHQATPQQHAQMFNSANTQCGNSDATPNSVFTDN